MVISTAPLRILTAVPICDGHDSAIHTINLELVRHGVEVIYLGYHRSAPTIVRAAIQEDVRAIGISSYNGGHIEFFKEVIDLLKARGVADIGVFGGGGGTITHGDAEIMYAHGIDQIFFAGTSLGQITEFVIQTYAPSEQNRSIELQRGDLHPDRRLAKLLTAAIDKLGGTTSLSPCSAPTTQPLTIGFSGPGGAGKTTLIDEIVLRALMAYPLAKIAILSHDPSLVGKGALLGDRASMIYAQDNRVFMRSLATRGQAGGLAEATARCLHVLKQTESNGSAFDLILVETVGIGQEAAPFQNALVDKTVLVMGPDYGSRLQLQKITLLDLADIVVVNKADRPGASTALTELEYRLTLNHRDQKLIATVAKHHRDPGVDQLYRLLGGI
jgi:methylmalonyl-CoA mutase cobalamin-binding domain/chain